MWVLGFSFAHIRRALSLLLKHGLIAVPSEFQGISEVSPFCLDFDSKLSLSTVQPLKYLLSPYASQLFSAKLPRSCPLCLWFRSRTRIQRDYLLRRGELSPLIIRLPFFWDQLPNPRHLGSLKFPSLSPSLSKTTILCLGSIFLLWKLETYHQKESTKNVGIMSYAFLLSRIIRCAICCPVAANCYFT